MSYKTHRSAFMLKVASLWLGLFMLAGFTNANAANASDPTHASAEGQGLTSDVLFKYLAAEIAGQRGDLSLAANLFMELAQSTQDPRLAERAAKAAIYSNSPATAVRAITLWVEMDPDSIEAQQAGMQMLVNTGKLNEAKPYLEKLLKKEDTRANGFLYLNGLFARQMDKAAVLVLVQSLAQPYPNLPEAHLTIANAAWSAKNETLAFDELSKAEGLRPGWELAAIMKGQMLQTQSQDSALKFYREYLSHYPKANEVRLNYSKLLLTLKRNQEAKVELIEISKQAADNPEILTVIGLLSSQNNEFKEAETYLLKSLTITKERQETEDTKLKIEQLYLYLGQNYERQNQDEQALIYYEKVGPGERYLDARTLLANLMVKKQGVDAAILMLDHLDGLTGPQQASVAQNKAQILNRAKRHDEAFKVLEQAVATLPNTPELVYDFAMTAERLQKLDVMEKQLRKIILMKPDFSAAYNALGYSFADRNINLQEAKTLIEKALMLSPEDHYILDSMGWVKFRLGEYSQALEYLEKAYLVHKDPEIAAHLGEVLWKQGREIDALKTWDDALKESPDNEILINTRNKYKR